MSLICVRHANTEKSVTLGVKHGTLSPMEIQLDPRPWPRNNSFIRPRPLRQGWAYPDKSISKGEMTLRGGPIRDRLEGAWLDETYPFPCLRA
ncbi:MAG: hypothetical protein GY809_21410 [Planctomycetes bacterium]|nr:hypothetical protein [Planctomycetota bacterium]